MKKRTILFLAVLLLCLCGFGSVYAAEPAPTLTLDGKKLETPDPPVIKNGRTLLPAKVLFEAMGGMVEWDGTLRQTTITFNETKVQLVIDSTTATVNGEEKTLDVPATIINRRTYVPVAFAARELGCIVDWEGATRIVAVASPKKIVNMNEVTIEESGGKIRVTIGADEKIQDYKGLSYDSPDRFVLDIRGAKLNIDGTDNSGEIAKKTELFSNIRYSQFEENTVRFVFDLLKKQTPHLSFSVDGNLLYVDFDLNSAGIIGDDGSGIIGGETVGTSDLPLLDPRMREKLIVIDAGHGGTDSGSLGYINGEIVLKEKDINLPIAVRLDELLRAAGAQTKLIRSSDSSHSLYSRPAMANELSAALFVSCHNNSNESATPHGTEVHYYNKAGDVNYGYTSKEIALSVMKELNDKMKLTNRGTKSSPSLAVLNKTQMPAIIIEGAFISNPSDLAYMMTPKYIEDYAQATAKGIINALNAAAGKN